MIKVYGSPFCPDCVELKSILDKNNKQYTYIDISGQTSNLKEFLLLRDTNDAFKNIIGSGMIGIPAIVFEDGHVELEYTTIDLSLFPDGERNDQTGKACDLKSGHC